jgi:hypothetical protein
MHLSISMGSGKMDTVFFLRFGGFLAACMVRLHSGLVWSGLGWAAFRTSLSASPISWGSWLVVVRHVRVLPLRAGCGGRARLARMVCGEPLCYLVVGVHAVYMSFPPESTGSRDGTFVSSLYRAHFWLMG